MTLASNLLLENIINKINMFVFGTALVRFSNDFTAIQVKKRFNSLDDLLDAVEKNNYLALEGKNSTWFNLVALDSDTMKAYVPLIGERRASGSKLWILPLNKVTTVATRGVISNTLTLAAQAKEKASRKAASVAKAKATRERKAAEKAAMESYESGDKICQDGTIMGEGL